MTPEERARKLIAGGLTIHAPGQYIKTVPGRGDAVSWMKDRLEEVFLAALVVAQEEMRERCLAEQPEAHPNFTKGEASGWVYTTTAWAQAIRALEISGDEEVE